MPVHASRRTDAHTDGERTRPAAHQPADAERLQRVGEGGSAWTQPASPQAAVQARVSQLAQASGQVAQLRRLQAQADAVASGARGGTIQLGRKGRQARLTETLNTLKAQDPAEGQRIEDELNNKTLHERRTISTNLSQQGRAGRAPTKAGRDQQRARLLARQFPGLPDNFDDQTTYGTRPKAGEVYPENLIQVETKLNPEENIDTPMDQWHSHTNYFGPTTWVIGNVYKPKEANYFLSMAIKRQHELAVGHAAANGLEAPTPKPTQIIIHNVMNDDTRQTIMGYKSGANIPIDVFRTTTFGKSIEFILKDISDIDGEEAKIGTITRNDDPSLFISINYG